MSGLDWLEPGEKQFLRCVGFQVIKSNPPVTGVVYVTNARVCFEPAGQEPTFVTFRDDRPTGIMCEIGDSKNPILRIALNNNPEKFVVMFYSDADCYMCKDQILRALNQPSKKSLKHIPNWTSTYTSSLQHVMQYPSLHESLRRILPPQDTVYMVHALSEEITFIGPGFVGRQNVKARVSLNIESPEEVSAFWTALRSYTHVKIRASGKPQSLDEKVNLKQVMRIQAQESETSSTIQLQVLKPDFQHSSFGDGIATLPCIVDINWIHGQIVAVPKPVQSSFANNTHSNSRVSAPPSKSTVEPAVDSQQVARERAKIEHERRELKEQQKREQQQARQQAEIKREREKVEHERREQERRREDHERRKRERERADRRRTRELEQQLERERELRRQAERAPVHAPQAYPVPQPYPMYQQQPQVVYQQVPQSNGFGTTGAFVGGMIAGGLLDEIF
eukprot:c8707_g1_i1.p1 GENE.c8707_g1_i1~~c8707_g1_i1.p1  ORF type:complete len:450 (+),score=78.78 c8707_g1_i1:42-1391(+)